MLSKSHSVTATSRGSVNSIDSADCTDRRFYTPMDPPPRTSTDDRGNALERAYRRSVGRIMARERVNRLVLVRIAQLLTGHQ